MAHLERMQNQYSLQLDVKVNSSAADAAAAVSLMGVLCILDRSCLCALFHPNLNVYLDAILQEILFIIRLRNKISKQVAGWWAQLSSGGKLSSSYQSTSLSVHMAMQVTEL